MTAIAIEGGLGSGKTLLMTRYLLKDFLNGNKIFSNYNLVGIDHTLIDMSRILDMHKNDFNLNDCSLGIDEITVFADCRKSSSKMNRAISYFILQSRKRNVDLYFTTQNLNLVDFRLVSYLDFQILCDKAYDENGKELADIRKYRIFDLRNPRDIKITRFMLDISKYYKYYDTNEVILPPV